MGSYKERDYSEELETDSRILKSVVRKWSERVWTGFGWFRRGTHYGLF
jgi:hypothetical protein